MRNFGGMKKVLVTGSNGLLGQKLTDLYRKRTDRMLIATGKGRNRHPENDFVYASMDISHPESVQAIMHTYRPDTVIHTAAMTNVDACELDHATCDELNVAAVAYVCEAAEAIQAHVIHLSTDFIFDGNDGPYGEDALPNPLSYYGHSKLKGEQIVQNTCSRWAIIRTVLVYGLVHDMSRSNIVLWARGALQSGKPFKVVNDQWRTPTLAEDLAMGCMLAEEREAQGVFNISGSDFMNISGLVKRVAAHYGLDVSAMEEVSSDTLNQAAQRPPRTGFILDKARNILGYNPHSFEEGLRLLDTWESARQQP
jgi:dTDP-4-dehydrorhamnose reductase